MTNPDIAALAKGLTKAERKWLPTFTDQFVALYPIGLSRRTLDALVKMGLVERQRPASFGMVQWRLTETGLRLRAHLQQQGAEA